MSWILCLSRESCIQGADPARCLSPKAGAKESCMPVKAEPIRVLPTCFKPTSPGHSRHCVLSSVQPAEWLGTELKHWLCNCRVFGHETPTPAVDKACTCNIASVGSIRQPVYRPLLPMQQHALCGCKLLQLCSSMASLCKIAATVPNSTSTHCDCHSMVQ
jgi:hypothetical protein